MSGATPARQSDPFTQSIVKPGLTRKRPRRVVENDDFGAFAARIVAAYGRRVARGDIEALTALSELHGEVEQALAVGVAGLRREGWSWTEIGRRFGITKQAAFQRWGHSVVAEPPAGDVDADEVPEAAGPP